MTHPLEDRLRQLRPHEPQLDWKQIWLEQGRTEGRREVQPHRWWSHPAWTGLSLVSTAASVVLAVVLAGRFQAVPSPEISRPGSTGRGPVINSLASPDSHQSPTEALEQQPTSPGSRTERMAAAGRTWNPTSWLASWQGLEVRPQWQRRQQLLAQGAVGLEVYLTSGPAPRPLPPRNKPLDRDSNWLDLFRQNQSPAPVADPAGSILGDLL